MRPNLLQPLHIIPQLLIHPVTNDVQVFPVGDILPPVEEPGGDLELGGVLHDGDDAFEFVGVEFSGTAGTYPPRRVISISIEFDIVMWCVRGEVGGLTACSNPHQPSCKPSSSTSFRHP